MLYSWPRIVGSGFFGGKKEARRVLGAMAAQYQRKDHLYRQAKDEGYRSRAAYKLLELDKRYGLLKKGMTVLDLGSFPGGWLQVALKAVGQKGRVVGIDLREVQPVVASGGLRAEIIQGDILDPEARRKIKDFLPQGADLLISDMSHQLTGVRFQDSVKSAELVEMALDCARELLIPGGALVAKIFPSAECEALAKDFKELFQRFARPNLDSSRKSSKELYFVGRGFGRN